MLSPFRLIEPASVAEASEQLGNLGESARVYAGGVELLLLMRHGIVDVEHLINIKHIPGMDSVAWDGQHVHVGATTAHARIVSDPLLREHLPLLVQATAHVGNVRVRTQGTIGGNLCFADPHADPATALLVHEASVVVGGSRQRQMSLEDFLVGTYETALEPDELLVELLVPPLPSGWGSAYSRLEQFYRPTLNTAVAVLQRDGQIADVRLAVGCIGPKALRLGELEQRLRGLSVADAQQVISESAAYLNSLLDPVDDLLGSVEYKTQVATVYLGRTLEQAVQSGGYQAEPAIV